MSAREIIDRLGLEPHPEGGWYRQTWVSESRLASRPGRPSRAAGTCIFYLLESGQRSRWHRIDSTEIWHYYVGSALLLQTAPSEADAPEARRLGPDLSGGEIPQIVVPKRHWQSAVSLGEWTLAGCTVSPGFEFEGFELAPDRFNIPGEIPGNPGG